MSRQRPHKQNSPASERGLTLLEVMAAVTILALATSALLIGINRDFDKAVDSNQLRIVKMLSTKKMEEVLLFYTSGNQSQTLETSGNFESDGYPQFEWSLEEEELNLTTEEEKRDGREDQILYKVTLTVKYKKEDGTDAEYKLSSVVEPPKQE
ncbi:MAG: type II secretion system GspH family protein [Planctomycetota bacterium]|nr:type II secretion system GspH family protein [Planctomycetota bacterium]